jgi:predicted RNase H-like HicB family nuclease
MAHLNLTVIVHRAEEGGYWAEIPAIPGCASQGDTFVELVDNLHDAVAGCLSVDTGGVQTSASDRLTDEHG